VSTRSRRIALAVWRPFERRAAGAYFAGPVLADALAAADRIAARGYEIALAYWNADGADPEEVARENLAALAALSDRGLNRYVSVKAPALQYSRELVRQIAAEGPSVLHFDSHGCEAAEETLAVATAAREEHGSVGITIPGRWRRSLADADRAVDQGLRVRVVKGEWADPEDPDLDMRDGFLAVVDRLAGRATHVSVATHDHDLAREAVERLAGAGTPHDIELLLGLPFDRVVAVAQKARLPARVYVPYGHASLRYGLGYLRRNPRRAWWLARDLVLRRRRAPPPPYGGPIETRSRSSPG
jgi:proline dehydrogenase